MAHVSARQGLPSRYSDKGADVWTWLREKAQQDSSCGGGLFQGESIASSGRQQHLWMVHGKWYDLSSFIDSHPGGRDWLEFTRGHDISEAYEVHHLNSSKVEALLRTMYVCDADKTYVGRYCWDEDGFYRTIKRRVADYFLRGEGRRNSSAHSLPSTGPTIQFQLISLLAIALHFAVFASMLAYNSAWMALLAGLTLQTFHGIGHNAMHRRDNFWMYAYDMCGWKHYKHRVSHALSHHLFPNTALDLEHPEPASYSFTANSHENSRWVVLTGPLSMWSGPLRYIFELWIGILRGTEACRPEYAFNVVQLALCMQFGGGIMRGLALFSIMHLVCGFCIETAGFGLHRSIYCWSLGDPNAKFDYAEHCLAATADHDVEFSLIPSLFLFQILNNHAIHHLFPTIDKSRIDEIMPIFKSTCEEFGIPWQSYEWADIFGSLWKNWTKGMFTQRSLISVPPRGHPIVRGSKIRIVPLLEPYTFGAQVTGIDVTSMSQSEWKALEQACINHGVVVIRDQSKLTPEDHVSFARRFPHNRTCNLMQFCGPLAKEGLDADEWRKFKLPGRPEIQLRGHIDLNDHYGVTGFLDTRKGAREFHVDSVHEYETPPVFTTLHCLLTPGNDHTLFIDARTAYDRLSSAEKELVESLFVQYRREPSPLHASGLCADFNANLSTLGKIYGEAIAKENTEEGIEDIRVSQVHPLVWTHPNTGLKALSVAGMWMHRLIDKDGNAWTREESHEFILKLLQPAAQTLMYAHDWRQYDLVVFDNRSVMHSASPASGESGDRLLHQIILSGDRIPVGPAGSGVNNPIVNPNVVAVR